MRQRVVMYESNYGRAKYEKSSTTPPKSKVATVVVCECDGPARSIKLDLGWAARNRKKGSHYGSALIGRRGVNPGALVSGG